MTKYDEMVSAVREAEATLEAADRAATMTARLMVGRLRKVNSGWILSALKKELQDYNMHTSAWKKP